MLPNISTSTCCISDPPDLPIRDPNTSIAALPFTFDSSSNGMYAICVVGSNSAYLVVLLINDCMVPKITAMRKRCGLSNPTSILRKYGKANIPMAVGVANAPIRHPNIRIACTPKKMTIQVDNPTILEKLPINR